MDMINGIVNFCHTIWGSWKHIPYTIKHIIWVNRISKRYFNKRYLLHDMDKVVMYAFMPFLGTKWISAYHRASKKHHINDLPKNVDNYIEMVCDWESARFTKPDKPLNAKDTCAKYYPDMMDVLTPFFNKFDATK